MAEWVETQETVTLLKDLSIDYVQGNFSGKSEPFSSKDKQEKIDW